MRTITHGIMGIISVAVLLGGMLLVAPLGSEAEASGKKYIKKFFENHVSNKDLEGDHQMLKDWIDKIEDNQTLILEKLDNLPAGGGGGGGTVGPCDMPPVWDEHTANAPARFVSVFGGTAYCDQDTGIVWESSPGDTTFPPDDAVDSTDKVNWDTARRYCLNKNVGGAEGWRLPSVV